MAKETQFIGDHYSNNLSQWKWGQENREEGRAGRSEEGGLRIEDANFPWNLSSCLQLWNSMCQQKGQ